ncbi:MAG: DUF4404 family protein [Nevskia sp.]|nr:DUF4404 family protein [Nevskia sp.]
MKTTELHDALERLRGELARTDFSDASAKEHLRQLIDDIEQHSGSSGAVPERQALVERLGESIRRFEVEHPNFTGYLGQLISSLSNMGI